MSKFAIIGSSGPAHLAESLSRAFVARGHEVFWTGRIEADWHDESTRGSEAAVAVRRVLQFRPDATIVMEPSLLTESEIKLLSRYGPVLAWFGLDTLFFQDRLASAHQYDVVLHDAGAEVLDLYSSHMGRVSGVSFPSWTDHIAAPAVWGTGAPLGDIIVEGDFVATHRRRDYAEISQLGFDIDIYGQIGSDYAGLGRGRLDSVAELGGVAGGYGVALLFPPRSEDFHREASRFEVGICARTVTFMAMGIPTVSVTSAPGMSEIYPQMRTAGSVSQASGIIASLLKEDLDAVSREVTAHFDTYFTASARVEAIEALIADDAWRSLPTPERAHWFMQFQGGENAQPDAGKPLKWNPPRVDSPRVPKRSRFIVIGPDSRSMSRGATLSALLEDCGYSVRRVSPEKVAPALVDASVKNATVETLEVKTLLAGEEAPATIVFTDSEVTLRPSERDDLHAAGFTLAHINDSRPWSIAKARAILSSFDLVATSNRVNVDRFHARGFDSLFYLPQTIHRDFVNAIAHTTTGNFGPSEDQKIIKVSGDGGGGRTAAPALGHDVPSGVIDADYEDPKWLEGLGFGDLESHLRSGVTIGAYVGENYAPIVPDVMAYAAASSESFVFTRARDNREIYPFDQLGYLVGDVGEFASKARLIVERQEYREAIQDRRDKSIHALKEAERAAVDALASLQDSPLPRLVWTRDKPFVATSVEVGEIAKPIYIRADFTEALGDPELWRLRVKVNSSYVGSTDGSGVIVGLVTGTSPGQVVSVELTYRGVTPVVSFDATNVRINIGPAEVSGPLPSKLKATLEKRLL